MITTSGALGILIPPSIVMVMYAVATNTSVGALFIAGIVPGLILASLLGLTTWYRARKFNYPRQPKASARERIKAFRDAIWGLLLIVVVIGGIYTGIFTPTEAAAMSAVYAFFVAVFVYKDMTLKRVPKVLLDSANMSAMLLYIITNAVMFSYLMTSENIPQALAAWMLDKHLGAVAFLLAVNVILLLAGNVMEPSSHRADHGAHPVPGGHEAGHRPGALRHHDDREHGGGHVPPAGGAEPVRGFGNYQDGDHGAHRRGLAVAADDAGLPGARHVLARHVAVAAAHAGDALVAAAAHGPGARPELPALAIMEGSAL